MSGPSKTVCRVSINVDHFENDSDVLRGYLLTEDSHLIDSFRKGKTPQEGAHDLLVGVQPKMNMQKMEWHGFVGAPPVSWINRMKLESS